MKGTSYALEAVPDHEAGKVLTVKYLKQMEEAVRGRTPLKGENINILYVDGGAIISVATGATGVGGGTPIVLTVCSNGVPSVVTVVGYQ